MQKDCANPDVICETDHLVWPISVLLVPAMSDCLRPFWMATTWRAGCVTEMCAPPCTVKAGRTKPVPARLWVACSSTYMHGICWRRFRARAVGVSRIAAANCGVEHLNSIAKHGPNGR
jgi:hypothetical protein